MITYSDFFGPKVLAFTTDRSCDFSFQSAQDPFNDHQKRYLDTILHQKASFTVNIHQVHSDDIVIACDHGFDALQDADGIITNTAYLPIAIRTADCLPVFIFDEVHQAIALVHCGWRPTEKSILKKTLSLLKDNFFSKPSDLRVAFGPAIRKCCYKVGPEFLAHFGSNIEKRGGQYYFDLVQENKEQLLSCGVDPLRIFDVDICTVCDGACFSFRRETENAGRMLSLMMLNL